MNKKFRFKSFLYINYERFFKTKRWRQEHIARNGYVLTTFLFFSLLLGLDVSKNSTYHIFSILLSILTISIINSIFFRSKFDIKRILPKYGTVNQELIYELHIKNLRKKKELSIFYEDRFESIIPTKEEFIHIPEPNENKRNIWDRNLLYYRWLWLVEKKKIAKSEKIELPEILENELKTVKVKIKPLKRGFLKFDLSIYSRADIFNMFFRVKYVQNNGKILILPQRYSIFNPRLDSENLNNSEDSEFLSIIGQGNEFFALRDYRDGDHIRDVHWKSWAKRGKPVIKEYQKISFSRKALILDVYGSDKDIFEKSISIAASYISPINNKVSVIDEVLIDDYKEDILNNEDNILIYLAKLNMKLSDFNFYSIESNLKTITGAIIILNKMSKSRIDFLKYLEDLGIETYIILLKNKLLTKIDSQVNYYEKDIKKYNIKVVYIDDFENELLGLNK